MLYFSKEATNTDPSFKMQMMLSIEKIWSSNGFFGDLKRDFTIKKANLPENTLVYCNQGTISTLKVVDYAIYFDYVI